MRKVSSEEFRMWNVQILHRVGGELGSQVIVDNDGNTIGTSYFDWNGELRAQLIDGIFFIDDSWDYSTDIEN